TSNICMAARNRPQAPLFSRKVFTRPGSWMRWGSSDAGIAASASTSSRMSATRIVVSCVQAQRHMPQKPRWGGDTVDFADFPDFAPDFAPGFVDLPDFAADFEPDSVGVVSTSSVLRSTRSPLRIR